MAQRTNFANTSEADAVAAGYMDSTRLSPITPKNKAQILTDYRLSTGAAKGMDDTAMSRMAAQAVLDKFVRDREEARRIAREAEEARLRAEAEAKAAAEEEQRQAAAAIAAEQARIHAEATYRAQVAAQQAAIAARSMTRIPAYSAPTAPIRAPQPAPVRIPTYVAPVKTATTIQRTAYVAPKTTTTIQKTYVAPAPVPSRYTIR